jgi:hypothetical protein
MLIGGLRLPECRPSYSPTYIRHLAIVERDGIKVPILIDERGTIRSGMALYFAACHLGLASVPVVAGDRLPVRNGQFQGVGQ